MASKRGLEPFLANPRRTIYLLPNKRNLLLSYYHILHGNCELKKIYNKLFSLEIILEKFKRDKFKIR